MFSIECLRYQITISARNGYVESHWLDRHITYFVAKFFSCFPEVLLKFQQLEYYFINESILDLFMGQKIKHYIKFHC